MAQEIPTLDRHVSAEPVSQPSIQGAMEDYAESTNNLSAIGAQVAQVSSNKLASQLGFDQGKNPKGDLLPPITDFDKQFADSYHAQAYSTLSLQGQKLLDDTHIEMSKSPRLTPGLISKAQAQMQTGLAKISEQAPTEIKTKLQEGFDSQVLKQTTQYNEQMISDQREDQKNTLINAIDLNQKNILEAGQNGDQKTVETLVEQNKKLISNGEGSKFFSPEQARTANETSAQNALNGTYNKMAIDAYKSGKYAEFERSYAEKKPTGMTHEQWMATGQSFAQQVNFLEGLRAQDQNLRSQRMINQIAIDPFSVTPTQFQDFQSNVDPMKFEEVKFKYIQALKKGNSAQASASNLVADFGNPEAFANATPKTKNEAYNKLVDYTVQQSPKNGQPLSRDAAEVQVAAQAGGEIPAFTNSLKNKLASGNPQYIESAAQQIHALQSMGAGGSLRGLNDQDKAAYSMYESLRNTMQPVDAAREASQVAYNQDPKVQQLNKQKWSNKIQEQTRAGTPLSDYALKEFGLKQDNFMNPTIAQVYASSILEKYSTNFQLLNGNDDAAKKLTQRFIDENFGDTGVNGGSFTTMHPLEKMLGFEGNDGTPYIQQDIATQLNGSMKNMKDAYDKKLSNEYWEVEPLSNEKHGIFKKSYDPVKVTQYMRTPKGIKKNTYNLIVQGNEFDSWDLAIQTDSGIRNLSQAAPYLGAQTYTPNVNSIKTSWNKDNDFKKQPSKNEKVSIAPTLGLS